MLSNDKKLIAVVGARGQQGGGVLRALQARGQFKVRALTRNPDKHLQLAFVVFPGELIDTGNRSIRVARLYQPPERSTL